MTANNRNILDDNLEAILLGHCCKDTVSIRHLDVNVWYSYQLHIYNVK